jgi:hypothetical protein
VSKPASFEKINYSIRPAKATQRRMLVEAFGRLAALYPLHRYQYIGLGSTFFIDFKMIHRQYGIRQLYSIEKEKDKRRRFDFNKPYSCVKMFYGTAGEYFASTQVRWSRPSIVWLDYDYRLKNSVLADIDRVVEKARAGSLLIVTVDAEPPPARELREVLDPEIDLRKLLGFVGGRVGRLGGDGLAGAYHTYATAEIESKLRRARPGVHWRQLFNFRYADGHRMLTFGGVLVDPSVEKRLENCHFEELPYYQSGEAPFAIEVPNLTGAEVHKLAQSMPRPSSSKHKALLRLAIEERDLENYEALYRYLPQFIESHV